MEAKEVIEKILSEAREEADAIIKKAEQEVSEFNEETEKLLADFDKQSETLAKNAADDKKQRILASARMKSRKDILSSKQKVLAEVFENARQKLLDTDRDSYRNLYKKLISSAVENGDEVVIAGRKEDVIDASLTEEINADPGFEKASNLTFSQERGDFDRGVVLKRGDVRVNISVSVLLQMARESLETTIATELFAQ
ncbi:MAG: V-type ATP synthase subunit E [Sedimentisphaeraceae bacterium JB056]